MDFSKRSLIGFYLTLVFASACGGGSGENGITTTPNPNNQQTSGVDTSAIAGVWDESYNRNGVVDVLYWVINANGTFAYVDYLGDGLHGSYEHCYHYWRGRVATQGTDGYAFDRPGNNIPIILPTITPTITPNIDFNRSVVLYHMRVINGQLAILYSSNGQPEHLYPPVPGGLDPSIPECPPESG